MTSSPHHPRLTHTHTRPSPRYLACVEALPRALAYANQIPNATEVDVKKHAGLVLLSFMFGALVLGLVLIDHEHCVPGGGEHAH